MTKPPFKYDSNRNALTIVRPQQGGANTTAMETTDDLLERARVLLSEQRRQNLRSTDEFVGITHRLGMCLTEVRCRSSKYSFRGLELLLGSARQNLSRAVTIARVDLPVAIVFRKDLGDVCRVERACALYSGMGSRAYDPSRISAVVRDVEAQDGI
jgi:hypothetical protein